MGQVHVLKIVLIMSWNLIFELRYARYRKVRHIKGLCLFGHGAVIERKALHLIIHVINMTKLA